MEPESIDTSSIAITNPPGTMETKIKTLGQASIQNDTEAVMPLTPPSTSTAPSEAIDAPGSPQLTHALEALLGGLNPPVAKSEAPSVSKEASSDDTMRVDAPETINVSEQTPGGTSAESTAQIEREDFPEPATVPFESQPDTTGTPIAETIDTTAAKPVSTVLEDQPVIVTDVSMSEDANPIDPIPTTIEGPRDTQSATAPVETTDTQMGVETKTTESAPAAIERQSDSGNALAVVETTDVPMVEEAAGEEEHPEWEVDSSPIESSSDDSSDDSSSEESEEGDNAYKLLSPEEQARILMAGDGGSDDEGGTKAKGTGGQLRTKNEVPEVVIPKPDVTITPEMPIVELGVVETIVENIALIKAKTSGEYRVLESGSILCLENRSVIGVVAEPLGRVQQPLYSVLFTNSGEIKAAGLSVGTQVFYSEEHATYVFTQALKAFKGSDASNLHDEEVGDEEMEFSDDEAEMEHKRRVKQKRSEKHGQRMRDGGSSRGGHPLQLQHDTGVGLSYDETEDGPYKPLARPIGLANSIGHGEAPQEGTYARSGPSRDQFRGRGRGDRGRGRGDRGRGRGGFQSRGGASNGYSQPPQHPSTSSQSPTAPFTQPQFLTSGNGFSQAPPNPTNFHSLQQQYPPNQPQMPAWPQYPPQPPFQPQQPYQQQGFQQAYQNMQNMQNGWPNMPPARPLPAGAFINPAFFGNNAGNNNQWNQQGQQGTQGSGSRETREL